MFAGKTVFVLGAGANCDIGFPLGPKLKKRIKELLYVDPDSWPIAKGGSLFVRLFQASKDARATGLDQSAIASAAKFISDNIDRHESIDDFIFTFASRADVQIVAKIAIAYSLCESERESFLFPPEVMRQEVTSREWNESCYWSLWQRFSRGFDEKTILESWKTERNPVKFISFNYDRGLRQAFYHGLITKFKLHQEEAKEVAGKLWVQHVYGEIGKWMPAGGPRTGGLPFGDSEFLFGKLNEGSLVAIELSKGLRTYTEGGPEEHYRALRETLKWAEHIYFIGCAFHPQNLSAIFSLDEKCAAANVFGTGFGLDPTQCVDLTNVLKKFSSNSSHWPQPVIYHDKKGVDIIKAFSARMERYQ
jgi:hypothetical protein